MYKYQQTNKQKTLAIIDEIGETAKMLRIQPFIIYQLSLQISKFGMIASEIVRDTPETHRTESTLNWNKDKHVIKVLQRFFFRQDGSRIGDIFDITLSHRQNTTATPLEWSRKSTKWVDIFEPYVCCECCWSILIVSFSYRQIAAGGYSDRSWMFV